MRDLSPDAYLPYLILSHFESQILLVSGVLVNILAPLGNSFTPQALHICPRSFFLRLRLLFVDHFSSHTTRATMACLAFLLGSLGLLFSTTAATPLDKRAAIDTCLSSLSVPVLASGSADYTQSLKPFNLRVTFKPAAYAVPTTVKDVQNAVSCGAQNGVQVTAKSGGHSYASHGLGGEDGHLIVDMRNFNSVTVDQAAQTAVIGTGGRLGNVATALYSQGKQAISHGTCPGYALLAFLSLSPAI